MKKKVTIVGGGHQGLAMAAHLTFHDVDCYLWNRTEQNIKTIMEENAILCEGVVEGTAHIKHVSTDITECLQKVILVTVPSNAHEDIAKMLAPYMDETFIIVLNPGRTFGARSFAEALKRNGCDSLPIVAEAQTIVYTCRRYDRNKVKIYALKKDVPIATSEKNDLLKVMESLPECIRKYFMPVESDVITSLGNVGMILHCAPVLMNIGWIESEKVDFKYYYEGISPSISRVLEKIDEERLNVAKAMGYEIESLTEWLVRTYGTYGDNLFECLQNNIHYKDIDAPLSIHHRYIEEDVPNGLVPLENAGKQYNVFTPTTTLIIDLANIVMNKDYREIGRKLVK